MKKVLLICISILYVLLLPWPITVLIPSIVFSEEIKVFVILLLFAVEFVLGVVLIRLQLKKVKDTKKIGSKILFGLIILSYAIYSITGINYLIQVLLSAL